uniref:Venom dipeptidyl peptidase 4 n=1 Tax=Megaselia scalaris TaxID=36166 RepID=T1GYU6_MEGSC
KDLLFTVNNHLGTVEIQDQIGVTRSLIQNYKFIDETKTGIWGWSYGGYVTAMTMSKDDNHIFRCGVSVAPVTAWYYYDTIYTERYMGLPTKEDNLDNYIKGDISQDIRNFRTHKFMLIHGSGDDNVHIQHSLLLAKKLQYADIDFDEMTYTDENHSIGNALPHLYHTMDHFWGKCFR